MARLDWGDKIAFTLAVIAALVLARSLFSEGKDAGAYAILGAVAALLSAYWGQVNARAAREAALLAPSPAQQDQGTSSAALLAAVMAARPAAPPAAPPPPTPPTGG